MLWQIATKICLFITFKAQPNDLQQNLLPNYTAIATATQKNDAETIERDNNSERARKHEMDKVNVE